MRRILLAALLLPLASARVSAQASSVAPRRDVPVRDLVPLTDGLMSAWRDSAGPGCAVGVDREGQPRFTRAWGSAELEHGVRATPATRYESGSVSKQFTAAAIVLLALDGRLGLDDEVRKHVPELRAHDRPITIRHLLNHTSGLRDWGDLMELAGWPRGTRVHTHAHVLEVLSRQRALNFAPGSRYSYSNSGYNLLAIIVERASGMSFARFSTERLFAPLGLASTEWRDGYARLVKGRAQAYRASGATWRLDMPFEDVQGNGGLITTVDDLLAWTATLERPAPRWKAMVDSLHVVTRFTDGTAGTYALGLVLDRYRGLPRVSHSGATAGYRAMLLRFPGRGVAVAVLCNASSGAAVAYANAIADSLLAGSLSPSVTPSPRDPRPANSWVPTAADRAAYVGAYASPDVGVTWRIEAAGDTLLLVAPMQALRTPLVPASRDRFEAFAGEVWFTRDARGAVTALHAATGRAFDVTFERVPDTR